MARSSRSSIAAANLTAEMVFLSHRFRRTATVSTSTRSGTATSPPAAELPSSSLPLGPVVANHVGKHRGINDNHRWERSSERSSAACLSPTRPPRRFSMRSSTSSTLGRSASRFSSVARYCCRDWPRLSARSEGWRVRCRVGRGRERSACLHYAITSGSKAPSPARPRDTRREGRPGVEFSWGGFDEYDAAIGRGWRGRRGRVAPRPHLLPPRRRFAAPNA